jgi:hypothetical protein
MKAKYLASLAAGLLIAGSVPAYSEEQPQNEQPKVEKHEAKKVKPHHHPRDEKGIGGDPVLPEKAGETNPNPENHFHPRDGK